MSIFLMKIDNVIIGYSENEGDGRSILKKKIRDRIRELSNTFQSENIRVFREELDNKMILYIQHIGSIYNSSLNEDSTYELIKVNCVSNNNVSCN